jgi:hypothetical protein
VVSSRVAFVRRLWEATEDGGVEAALSLTDPNVEWAPFEAGGRVFRSSELLTWLAGYEGDRHVLSARAHTFREHGNRVLASGTFRLTGPDGLSEHHIHWVSEFDEQGNLVRARSYPSYAKAVDAVDRDDAAPQD